MKKYLLLLFMFLFSSICLPAKEHGELFSKEEANKLYGPVVKSISIPVSSLKSLMKNNEGNLLFNIVDNNLVLLNGSRTMIYNSNTNLRSTNTDYFSKQDPHKIFYVYSQSVINKLIESSHENMAQVELRKAVLTITIGNMTMERGALCPPCCPDCMIINNTQIYLFTNLFIKPTKEYNYLLVV